MEEQVVAPVKPQSEVAGDIASFVARYPFPLDAFQLEAIAHLAEGQSVMVAAPTAVKAVAQVATRILALALPRAGGVLARPESFICLTSSFSGTTSISPGGLRSPRRTGCVPTETSCATDSI